MLCAQASEALDLRFKAVHLPVHNTAAWPRRYFMVTGNNLNQKAAKTQELKVAVCQLFPRCERKGLRIPGKPLLYVAYVAYVNHDSSYVIRRHMRRALLETPVVIDEQLQLPCQRGQRGQRDQN